MADSMDLYSCSCGVVLNRSVMPFPRDIYNEDPNDKSTWGRVDPEKAIWNGDRYVAKTACPVCGAGVPRVGGSDG
jgi:hypothetical protein